MTIGTLTPGTLTTVTPDAQPLSRYASVQGPAVDGPIVATDVLQALQAALNVQTMLDQSDRAPVLQGTTSDMVALTGRQTGDYFEVHEQGRYRFQSGYTETMGAPWHYASTGTPGGLWRSDDLVKVLPGNQGVARIGPLVGIDEDTPIGRLPKTNLSGWVRNAGRITGASNFSVSLGNTESVISSTHYVDLSSMLVNDVVTGEINALMAASNTSVDGSGKIAVLLVSDWGGTADVQIIGNHDIIPMGGTSKYPIAFSFKGVISLAGPARIQIQVLAPSDYALLVTGSDTYSFSVGSYQVIRP